MHPTVQCPRPVRIIKHSLESIDSACEDSLERKHCHPASFLPHPASFLPQLPSPDLSDKTCLAPGQRNSESASRPAHRQKRAPEDSDSLGFLAKKQRIWQYPVLPLSAAVYQWLSGVPRPQTCPASFLGADSCTSIKPIESIRRPSSTPVRIEMSQGSRKQSAPTASVASARIGTSDPIYRTLIHCNYVTLDVLGEQIESEVQELLDTHILKGRDSPPLTDTEVWEVAKEADDLMDRATATDIFRTKAFPMDHRHVGMGGGEQWTTTPLPFNPSYPNRLSAPKPDRHYGYTFVRNPEWTAKEMGIIMGPMVQPFALPTSDNMFPFLMFETKSEAYGGTLYVAENKLVGSGVHSVASLRWLLQTAFPDKTLEATDAVAFTAAITTRAAVFYIVWFSEEKQRYVMSKFRDVSFLNGPKRPDIQDCRNMIKNIIDYGLDTRQAKIRDALKHWNHG